MYKKIVENKLMKKTHKLILTLTLLNISCTMNLAKRNPAQVFEKEKLQAYRQCFQELYDLSDGEQVGRFPWGKNGAYLVGVPEKFIPGAEALYLEYRYKPSSPQRDAALSSTYLYVTDEGVKSFVIPNFASDPNYDPMGRIKIDNEFYFYIINMVGDPTCFYDSKAKNINPYVKLTSSQCPVFNKQQFLTHNRKVINNPLMKVDAKKEHYTELKEINQQDQVWVDASLENEIRKVLDDAISSYSGKWAKAVLEAKRSDKVVAAPNATNLIIAIESSSCKEFEAVSTGLERIKKIEDTKKDDLNYYNHY
jgi:hypothetical protein